MELMAQDPLAREEPLELRLLFGPIAERCSRGLSITMRTPGDDFELAVGFLVSEGLVTGPADVSQIEFCGLTAGATTSNIVKISLAPEVAVDFDRLQRHVYTTSSCGLCGKSSLEALEHEGLRPVPQGEVLAQPQWIAELPAQLRAAQPVFAATGGLHAAGLFAINGRPLLVREDVGRHNAVDKVVGRMLLDGQLPLADRALVVSGRASFELVQKAVAARIPLMVAVGAPSSLAVDLARRFHITLIGFAGPRRFNCYSHAQRLHGSSPLPE